MYDSKFYVIEFCVTFVQKPLNIYIPEVCADNFSVSADCPRPQLFVRGQSASATKSIKLSADSPRPQRFCPRTVRVRTD